MADETTNMGDRSVFAVFVRYIDFDFHEMHEKFLGMVEIVGSKGAEAPCAKICNFCKRKVSS